MRRSGSTDCEKAKARWRDYAADHYFHYYYRYGEDEKGAQLAEDHRNDDLLELAAEPVKDLMSYKHYEGGVTVSGVGAETGFAFTRSRLGGTDEQEAERREMEKQQQLEKRRGSLSRVATSNQLQRQRQDETLEREKTRRASMSRGRSGSILGAVASALGAEVSFSASPGNGANGGRRGSTRTPPPNFSGDVLSAAGAAPTIFDPLSA